MKKIDTITTDDENNMTTNLEKQGWLIRDVR